jgi:hypothetical protein
VERVVIWEVVREVAKAGEVIREVTKNLAREVIRC